MLLESTKRSEGMMRTWHDSISNDFSAWSARCSATSLSRSFCKLNLFRLTRSSSARKLSLSQRASSVLAFELMSFDSSSSFWARNVWPHESDAEPMCRYQSFRLTQTCPLKNGIHRADNACVIKCNYAGESLVSKWRAHEKLRNQTHCGRHIVLRKILGTQ